MQVLIKASHAFREFTCIQDGSMLEKNAGDVSATTSYNAVTADN